MVASCAGWKHPTVYCCPKRRAGGGTGAADKRRDRESEIGGTRMLDAPADQQSDVLLGTLPAASQCQDAATPNLKALAVVLTMAVVTTSNVKALAVVFTLAVVDAATSWLGGAGKGSRADQKPAESCHRFTPHTHTNNTCILGIGGGEGEGAPLHPLSPDQLPPRTPHGLELGHRGSTHGAPAACGIRVGTRGGRMGLHGVSPVAHAPCAASPGPPPTNFHLPGLHGSDALASAAAGLPEHAEHPSST